MEKLFEWGEDLSEGKIGPFDAALVFVLVYFACQALILPLVSHLAGTFASIDDAEQLIYLTHLSAGYGGSQPPLFTWINWAATHLFGINLLTLKIVKYLVLFVAFVSVHQAMRNFGYTRRTAAAAALGLFTVAQIVWEMQHALTHSVASLAFSALAFWAFAALLKRRTTTSYLFFGAAAALALLGKFNDVIFVLAMLGAAASIPSYRAVILDRRILLALLVLLLILAPTALWSIDHRHALFARVHKFGLDPSGDSPLLIRLTGLGEFAIATFDFTVMTLLACGLSFAAQRLNPLQPVYDEQDSDRFLTRLLVFGYGITLALVLASGTTAVRDRWLLPLLFLLPAWFAMRAARMGAAGWRTQYGLAGLSVAIAIAVMPASWYIQAWGGGGKSQTARLDYPALLSDLRAKGPVNTIVSNTSWIGNFRLVDKKLVLLNQEVPGFDRLIRAPAVLVWLGKSDPPAVVLQRLENAGYASAGPVERVSAPYLFLDKANKVISFLRLKKTIASPQK